MASKKWVVVGGGGSGIMVRSGAEMSSTAEKEKLATGAVVTAEAIQGTRMKFSKVSGNGPKAGWVSVAAGGKDLLVEVQASEGGQAADALTKVVGGSFDADETMALYNSLSSKKDKAAGTLLLTIPDLYLQESNPDAAVRVAQEGVDLFKGNKDKVGLAAAYSSLANAQLAQEKGDAASASMDEALKIFKELGDSQGHASVLESKIRILISAGKATEAVAAAKEAVRLVKTTQDAKATGAALIQLGEVCMDVHRPKDAVKAAIEAQELFASSGDKSEEAKAYLSAAYFDMNDEHGEAVTYASAAADIYAALGDRDAQANALYIVATAHITAIAIKQRSCYLPCQANTRGAIDAGKASLALFQSTGNRVGEAAADAALRAVLMTNGGEAAAQTAAALDQADAIVKQFGKVSYVMDTFEKKEKDKSVFNRVMFAWRQPIDGYHFTMLWEHKVGGVGENPRGGYRMVCSGTADRYAMAPMYHSIKAKFANAPDMGPLMIHMMSKGSGWNVGNHIAAGVNVVSAALTCKVHTLMFLLVDEATPLSRDEQDSARQFYIQPSTLAFCRSLRLEAPMVNVCFLGMDAATWHMHRAEAIAAIPDVLQSEESEIHFHKGTPIAPTLANTKIADAVERRSTYK